jgi:hypothetical protein
MGVELSPFRFKKAHNKSPALLAAETQKAVQNSLVSVKVLAEVKRTAFRRGVWFRALTRIERGVVDLTLRYVDDIKSSKLAKVLTAIMEKIQLATENMTDRLIRTVGAPLAKKISSIAVSWGYHSASAWAKDRGFARYLTLTSTKT